MDIPQNKDDGKVLFACYRFGGKIFLLGGIPVVTLYIVLTILNNVLPAVNTKLMLTLEALIIFSFLLTLAGLTTTVSYLMRLAKYLGAQGHNIKPIGIHEQIMQIAKENKWI